MTVYNDMHCHLGFAPNAVEVASRAQAEGALMFCNTVTPADWQKMRVALAPFGNVAVGFGMHPWYVEPDADPSDIVALLDEHDVRIIGEVGLDFGRRHEHTRAEQLRMFESIAAWTARKGDCLLSVHAVHAAAQALDILEEAGTLDTCTCIFHWFTGTSEDLKRAIEDGCYFSAGMRMLNTGRGREYARAIPTKRLLLETDLPAYEGEVASYTEMQEQLKAAADAVLPLKGADVTCQVNENAAALIGPAAPFR